MVNCDCARSPAARIPQFYAGRAVLITGATGFMGKVLVERLLSACPGVGKLFLLMRNKAKTKPQERLVKLKQSKVFDVLRERDPAQLDKLHVVCGDITQAGLGMATESLAELEEVSVVFNCAATVRFGDPLRTMTEQNVVSVQRLLALCDRWPLMVAFVHVSTGYCDAERATIAERVEIKPSALPNMLANVLAVPDNATTRNKNRIVYPKRNPYLYTKSMAEAVVADHQTGKYSAAIVRPTIVTSSLRHPDPGWIDSINGPGGALAAIIQGLLHVFHCDGSKRADLLPVDMAIDTLIAVAWETAIDNLATVRVYNNSTCENPTTWRELVDATLKDSREHPLHNGVWYPSCLLIRSKWMFETIKFFVQTVPFRIIECVMRLLHPHRNSLHLSKINGRLNHMNDFLGHFATNEWTFCTDNVRRLRARITHADAQIFNLDPLTIDWTKYYQNFARGCRLHLLKNKEEALPQSRKRLRRLYLIHRAVTLLIPILILITILFYLLKYFNLFG